MCIPDLFAVVCALCSSRFGTDAEHVSQVEKFWNTYEAIAFVGFKVCVVEA